jgi:hypothetical protein
MNLDFLVELARRSMRNAGLFAWALIVLVPLALFWEQIGIYVGLVVLAFVLGWGLSTFLRQPPPAEEPVSKLPPLSREDVLAAQSKLKNTRV